MSINRLAKHDYLKLYLIHKITPIKAISEFPFLSKLLRFITIIYHQSGAALHYFGDRKTQNKSLLAY